MASASASTKPAEADRVLFVSRVVWEHVLVPLVLGPARGRLRWCRYVPSAVASCALRAAEAMFPLVGLCCRAVCPSMSRSSFPSSRHYQAIQDAAAVPSPRCVAWIIANAARARAARHNCPHPGHGGGSENEDEAWGGAWEWERDPGWWLGAGDRRRAREQVAVLAGLCCGGHLGAAQMFVENNCECWVDLGDRAHDTGAGVLLPGQRRRYFWGVPAGSAEDNVVTLNHSGDSGSCCLYQGTALGDEFWSERGIFRIMSVVCANGHLDVLKWILSTFLKINKSNKLALQDCLLQAFINGRFHILKWLVDTFDLGDVSSSLMSQGTSFLAKNSIHDAKLFAENFLQWNFRARFAISVAMSKHQSVDEIVDLCEWIRARYAGVGLDFISWVRLPKHAKIVKWALVDVYAQHTLNSLWNLSCSDRSDLELGMWFTEEKGIIPTPEDFVAACSGRHDNVPFVEWLFKKVADNLSTEDLLESLHGALASQKDLTSKWLEQLLITTTSTKPKVCLSVLCRHLTSDRVDWLQWLLTRSPSYDIDFSPTEVASAINVCVESVTYFKLRVALYVLRKFPLSPADHHDLFVKLLKRVLEKGTVLEVNQLASIGNFSAEELKNFMVNYGLYPCSCSSKIAKWLLQFVYSTTEEPTVAIAARDIPIVYGMFLGLISSNKRGCAEWIFKKFSLTLPGVLEQFDRTPIGHSVDLATWKLLLRLFPGITWGVLKERYFNAIVAASPLHVQFTMGKFHVTMQEMQELCNFRCYAHESTKLWLSLQKP
ncbi:hypothetical protein Pelo_14149 [Pelomyxa schiedti]|nr:hypothetical protein Pelo_14149 [Pelomyxa schiedti]